MAYTFGEDSPEQILKKKEQRQAVLDWVISPITTVKKRVLEKANVIPSQEEMMRKIIYQVLREEGLLTGPMNEPLRRSPFAGWQRPGYLR